jgi:hypothetical protein
MILPDMRIPFIMVASKKFAAICVPRKNCSRAMMHLPDICALFILMSTGLASRSASPQNKTNYELILLGGVENLVRLG